MPGGKVSVRLWSSLLSTAYRPAGPLGRRGANLDAEVVDGALRQASASFVEVDGHPAQRRQRAVDLSQGGGVQLELEGIAAPPNELPVPVQARHISRVGDAVGSIAVAAHHPRLACLQID